MLYRSCKPTDVSHYRKLAKCQFSGKARNMRVQNMMLHWPATRVRRKLWKPAPDPAISLILLGRDTPVDILVNAAFVGALVTSPRPAAKSAALFYVSAFR